MALREIDRRVAKAVFGFGSIETDDCNGEDNWWLTRDGQHVYENSWGGGMELPQYSADIAAAWDVVDTLRDNLYMLWGMGCQPSGGPSDKEVWCQFSKELGSTCYRAEANTAPHAICLAALKAVGAFGDTSLGALEKAP